MTAEEYARKIEKWSSISGLNTHDFSGFVLKAAECDKLADQIKMLKEAARCSDKVAAILPGLISLVTAWFKSVGAKRKCDFNAAAAIFTWCGTYSVPYSTSDDNEAASEWNRQMSEVLSLIEHKLSSRRKVSGLRRKLDKACKATLDAADVDKDVDPCVAMRCVGAFVKELQNSSSDIKVSHTLGDSYIIECCMKSGASVSLNIKVY